MIFKQFLGLSVRWVCRYLVSILLEKFEVSIRGWAKHNQQEKALMDSIRLTHPYPAQHGVLVFAYEVFDDISLELLSQSFKHD